MGNQNKSPEGIPLGEAKVADQVQAESQRSGPWGMPQEGESMFLGLLEAAPDAL